MSSILSIILVIVLAFSSTAGVTAGIDDTRLPKWQATLSKRLP